MSNCRVWTLLLAVAVILTAACDTGGGESTAQVGDATEAGGTAAPEGGGVTPVAGGTVVHGITADTDSLDPHKVVVVTGYAFALYPYDTLLGLNAEAEIVPQIAESWKEVEGGYELSIRPGVTCEDGTELQPSHILASFERFMDPATEAPNAGRLFGEAGVEFSADDNAGTFTATSPKPFGDLLPNLAHPAASIICPAGLADPSKLKSDTFGTGPFTLERAARGNQYRFKKRDGYAWGPDGATTDAPGVPEEAVIRVVPDEATLTNLLLAGDVNIAAFEGADQQRLEDQASLRLIKQNGFAHWVIFNESEGRPTASEEVRRGLAQSLNMEEFVEASTVGLGTRALTFVLPGTQCFNPDHGGKIPEHNPEAASAVLDGIALKVIGFEGQNQGPEYMLEAFTAAGADVELQKTDLNAWRDTLFSTRDWDVALMSAVINATPTSRGTWTTGAPPGEGLNFGDVQNPEAEEAFQQYIRTPMPERCEHFAEMDKALIDRVDYVPVSYSSAVIAGNGFEFEVGAGLQFVMPSTITASG